MQICPTWKFYVAALALCSLAGCGDSKSKETAIVSGKVTYAGKPVTTGDIVFYPIQGRPGRGKIDKDGNYSLSTFSRGDGAIVGKHKVTIGAIKDKKALAEKFKEAQRSHQGVRQFVVEQERHRLVPRKYDNRETTTIEKEVMPGSNVIDIQIEAE